MRWTLCTPASDLKRSYVFGAEISRIASERPSVPEGAESSELKEVRLCERPRREASAMYICRRSWAKMDASEPPAPGWISRRQGNEEKGWGGIREVLRVWTRVGSVVVVDWRSVTARSRSSGSDEGSLISCCSSATELCASSYSFSAVVTGPSSPMRLAISTS